MAGRSTRKVSIVAIVFGWLMIPVLLVGCTGPTAEPTPAADEEMASADPETADQPVQAEQPPVEQPGDAAPGKPAAEQPGDAASEQSAAEQPGDAASEHSAAEKPVDAASAQPAAEEPGEAPPAGADSVALADPVGALSLIRMVASPDPKADGLQQFPEGSGVWIAFYAMGKEATETDAYVLRVVDESGATVTEVSLYGPQKRLPEGSQSAMGAGGLVVHAAVPVFDEDELPPAGDYRSVILLNGSTEAELPWSVEP